MLLKKEKETRVKFNPGLSANRPSNNWALEKRLPNSKMDCPLTESNIAVPLV